MNCKFSRARFVYGSEALPGSGAQHNFAVSGHANFRIQRRRWDHYNAFDALHLASTGSTHGKLHCDRDIDANMPPSGTNNYVALNRSPT